MGKKRGDLAFHKEHEASCPQGLSLVKKVSEHFVQVSDHPGLLDTSELLRPEAILKEKEAFRDYTKNDALGERVKRTYTEMHTKQTMAFVTEKHEKWLKFNHMRRPSWRLWTCSTSWLMKVIPTWTCRILCTRSKLQRGSEKSTLTRNGSTLLASSTILVRSWLFTASRSGLWWGTLSQLDASPSRRLCLGRRASKTTQIPMTPGTTAS